MRFAESNVKLKPVTPEFGMTSHPKQMGIKIPDLKTFIQNPSQDIQQLREIVNIHCYVMKLLQYNTAKTYIICNI